MRDVAGTDNHTAVIMSGFQQSTKYSIVADEKMFNILLGGYSDKPRAIIRELCTNALDSHVMAGVKDKPFTVVLPTRWDTNFMVRDFGVSLSHDDVMNLYTTIGKSTKTNDNNTVGKFGLGSKVPFAYTNIFTITAIQDGEKRVYSAYKDKGYPNLSLIVKGPTDEPQGLSVSFPVKEDDVYAFQQAAKRVLPIFDVIPENNLEITNADLTPVYQGSNWKIVKNDTSAGIQGIMVKQGCVLYPVDSFAISKNKRPEALDIFTNESIILDMPIGTVDITPFRESLSYDDTTIANIVNVLDDITGSIVDSLLLDIKSATTLWGAVANFNDIKANVGYKLQNLFNKHAKWNGKYLNNNILIKNSMVDYLSRRGLRMYIFKYIRNANYAGLNSVYGEKVFTPSKHKPLTVFYCSGAEQQVKFFKAKITACFASTNRDGIFIPRFDPNSFTAAKFRVLLGRPNDEQIKFVDIETVPFTKPERQKTERIIGLNFLRGEEFLPINSYHSDQDAFINGRTVYYVRTLRGNITDSNISGNYNLNRIVATLTNMKLLDHENDVILGIPASKKNIKIPEDWVKFDEFAKEALMDGIDTVSVLKYNKSTEILGNKEVDAWFQIMKLLNSINYQDGSVIKSFMDNEKTDMVFHNMDNSNHSNLLLCLNFILTKYEYAELFTPATKKIVEDWEKSFYAKLKELNTAYPMVYALIKTFNNIHSYSSLKDAMLPEVRDMLQAYIEKIDAERKNAIDTTQDTLYT